VLYCLSQICSIADMSPTATVMPELRPDLTDILSRDYGHPFASDVPTPPTISVSPILEQPTGTSVVFPSSAGPTSESPSIFSQQQSSESTIPTQGETEESEDQPRNNYAHHTPPSLPSSVNATDGSASVTSVSTTDETDHYWEQGDVANQFHVLSSRYSPRPRRSKKSRQDNEVVPPNQEDGRFMHPLRNECR
jgi:hypothetical protein